MDVCGGFINYRDPSGAVHAWDTVQLPRPPGSHATIPQNDFFVIFYDNGTQLNFDFRFPTSGVDSGRAGRLTAIMDRNGNAVTIERNNITGFPEKVTDSLKRTVGDHPQRKMGASRRLPPAGLASIIYTYYPGITRLNTVTRGGQTTTYSYFDDTDKKLKSIQDPKGYLTNFAYQSCFGVDRIQTIQFAQQMGPNPTAFDTYVYGGPVSPVSGRHACPADGGDQLLHATVTDPNGHVTDYGWFDGFDPKYGNYGRGRYRNVPGLC